MTAVFTLNLILPQYTPNGKIKFAQRYKMAIISKKRSAAGSNSERQESFLFHYNTDLHNYMEKL